VNKGTVYAITAYVIWGFFPLYFKFLQDVSALEIVAHRIVWSFGLLLVVLLIRNELGRLRSSISGPRFLITFLISSLLLGINWLVFVYGVNAGFIVETSLGYFINPLLSVLLGVVFLRERLRPLQWVAVGLAVIGVSYLTVNYGRLPWIALMLALSFGLYGLAKKVAPLGSFYGLTLETGMLFVPCSIYLIFLYETDMGSFVHAGGVTTVLLIFTGLITAVPLLLFGSAARQIDLSMLGLLQYIAPTLQFLIGVLIYREPFSLTTFAGFSVIWLALIILWGEGFAYQRSRTKPLAVN
jgi:chloramphenicol-sensitive protein RarD